MLFLIRNRLNWNVLNKLKKNKFMKKGKIFSDIQSKIKRYQ